ncbi:unnamed protein product, partial [Polarella glacialis]
FRRPPLEILDGLLGDFGSTRIAELGIPGVGLLPWDSEAGAPSLLRLDQVLTQVACQVAPAASGALGLELTSRSTGLLHEAAGWAGKPGAPELSQDECCKWFQVFVQHKIM